MGRLLPDEILQFVDAADLLVTGGGIQGGLLFQLKKLEKCIYVLSEFWISLYNRIADRWTMGPVNVAANAYSLLWHNMKITEQACWGRKAAEKWEKKCI